MAQRVPKQLIPGSQLTATIASYYTVPANAWTTISAATLSNNTATARFVSIHFIPSGGVNSGATLILFQRVIAPGETYVVGSMIGHTLPPGASIQAVAEVAAAVNLICSGYETNY